MPTPARRSRPWRSLLRLAPFVVAGVTMATSASAETFTFAGRSIMLDVPKGYCRLERTNTSDLRYITAMEKIQEGRNHVVFMFANCADLAAARAGRMDQLVESGAVMIVLNNGAMTAVAGMTRREFVDEGSRQVAIADTASLHDELRKRGNDARLGVDLGAMKVLGVLKKDERAAYIGFLIPAGAGGSTQAVVSVNAMTLINALPVSVAIGRTAVRESVADELLVVEQRAIAQLVDANAAIEAAAPQPESFVSGVLRSAIVGGLTAGLGALAFAFIQRRRQPPAED